MEREAAIELRDERPDDVAAIREVNRQAFRGDQEADIVEALRANGGVTLSLVATVAGRVVGHILFSPLTVDDAAGAALAPMAVLPDFQRQGIGRLLVEAGSRRLDASGCPFIVVLGHPTYYPRFGFEPASRHGITCAWGVPDEAFMVRVFDAARTKPGRARYRPEFEAAE